MRYTIQTELSKLYKNGNYFGNNLSTSLRFLISRMEAENMSFRFDRQHLTGQQRAITAKRDSATDEIKKVEITKVDQMISFIGKDQIFDLTLAKHEPEQSGYGSHDSKTVIIENGYVSISELKFKGILSEGCVESVEKQAAKMIFRDDDGYFIHLEIIKRKL